MTVLSIEAVVANAADIIRRNMEPVQFQHRYRMPEHGLRDNGAGARWSKWSGWKNGGIPRNTIVGWQYEARGLYAL